MPENYLAVDKTSIRSTGVWLAFAALNPIVPFGWVPAMVSPLFSNPKALRMTHRVSVVIPTKNRPDGVRQAVSSVMEALPDDGEIIVVDDGSVPPATESLSVLRDPRLRILVNSGPHGPSAARNFGVKNASGDVILFLDDDDLMVADYCDRVMTRFPDLPSDCTFGFSASYHLQPDGSQVAVPSISPEGVLGNETPLKFRQAGLGMGCWITKQVFDDVGGLDEDIDVNEDTEFSIRLAANGHRCYCDQMPGVVLIHDPVRSSADQSSITKGAGARKRYQGFEYILTKHRDYLRSHTAFRRKMYSRVLKYRVRAVEAAGWIRYCAAHRPLTDVLLYGILGSIYLGLVVLIKRRP